MENITYILRIMQNVQILLKARFKICTDLSVEQCKVAGWGQSHVSCCTTSDPKECVYTYFWYSRTHTSWSCKTAVLFHTLALQLSLLPSSLSCCPMELLAFFVKHLLSMLILRIHNVPTYFSPCIYDIVIDRLIYCSFEFCCSSLECSYITAAMNLT